MSFSSPSSGGGSASKQRRKGTKPTQALIKMQKLIWNAILLGRDKGALTRIVRDVTTYFRESLGTPVAGQLGFLMKANLVWTDRSIDLLAIYKVTVEEVWPQGIPPPPPPAPVAPVFADGDDDFAADAMAAPPPKVMVSLFPLSPLLFIKRSHSLFSCECATHTKFYFVLFLTPPMLSTWWGGLLIGWINGCHMTLPLIR